MLVSSQWSQEELRIWNKGLMGFQEIKNRGKLYEMYKSSLEEITGLVTEANKTL